MKVTLRQLRVHPLTDGIGRNPEGGTVPPPAQRLLNGKTCDGCRWPARCRQDKICWAAEKKAIADEVLNAPVVWTRKRVIRAIHDWVDTHGRIPTLNDWITTTSDHPSAKIAAKAFTNKQSDWSTALRAAGYEPLGQWGVDKNDYAAIRAARDNQTVTNPTGR